MSFFMSKLSAGFQVEYHELRWSWRGESPPLPFWPCIFLYSPGYNWPSHLQVHVVASCPISRPPVTLLHKAALSPLISQPELILGVVLIQVWECCSWLCRTLWGSLFRPVKIFLGGIHSPCSAWSNMPTCWGCIQSNYVIREEDYVLSFSLQIGEGRHTFFISTWTLTHRL